MLPIIPLRKKKKDKIETHVYKRTSLKKLDFLRERKMKLLQLYKVKSKNLTEKIIIL